MVLISVACRPQFVFVIKHLRLSEGGWQLETVARWKKTWLYYLAKPAIFPALIGREIVKKWHVVSAQMVTCACIWMFVTWKLWWICEEIDLCWQHGWMLVHARWMFMVWKWQCGDFCYKENGLCLQHRWGVCACLVDTHSLKVWWTCKESGICLQYFFTYSYACTVNVHDLIVLCGWDC